MYKVMIVDDEPLMREAISSMINWKEAGFSLVADTYDGLQAIKVLENQDIDLVLTDMKMPKMNGLSLIEHTIKNYPNLKYIVLSAYDEFHMVRDAFNLGIKDYLLKAEMTSEQLREVLSNIRTEFDRVFEDRGVLTTNKIAQKAVKYIDLNFANEISLLEVADYTGVSSSYLSRVFSQETDYCFSTYLTKVRIDNAIKIMNSTNMKMYEIAEKVGYTTPEHFSRMFKKITGKSPMQFTTATS
jgi:two-component system response regulator YesN